MSSKEVPDLDFEYSPSQWSHRVGPAEAVSSHVNFLTKESEKARETIDCELGVSYGDTEAERLDIFGDKSVRKDAPIFVYIHGGYWQLLSLEMSGFMVTPLVRAGALVISVEYELAPKATMPVIVDQVRCAVRHILNLAEQRGSKGVYLCGHSAGAHLAAMVLETDYGDHKHLIKGAVLVSGIYDIRPLVNTYVNKPIKMTEEVAWQNSPENPDNLRVLFDDNDKRFYPRIIVVYGQHDPPTFHEQSKHYTQILQDNGVSCRLIYVPNTDHFTVIEQLADRDYIVTEETIRLMDLCL